MEQQSPLFLFAKLNWSMRFFPTRVRIYSESK